MEFWLKGVIMGFSIAAPVGPIGLLCIQRTLDQGRQSGFISGLGAASADAVYGSIAAFGMSAVFLWIGPWQTSLQIAGSIFLMGLGIHIFRKKEKPSQIKPSTVSGVFSAYGSTFLLTLSNPATILSFLAIFSGAGLPDVNSSGWFMPLTMIAGVFCGSALWWFLLSTMVSFLRNRFLMNREYLRWINRIAGIILLGFGLFNVFHVFLLYFN